MLCAVSSRRNARLITPFSSLLLALLASLHTWRTTRAVSDTLSSGVNYSRGRRREPPSGPDPTPGPRGERVATATTLSRVEQETKSKLSGGVEGVGGESVNVITEQENIYVPQTSWLAHTDAANLIT